MLEIRNLRLSIGKKTLFTNLNMDIKESQRVAILGENGAGKSSLAKAICGVEQYEGSILLFNRELTSYHSRERAKNIAMMPTSLELFEKNMPLLEFVLLGGFAKGMDKTQALQILESLNLLEHVNKSVVSLSSGEQKLSLFAKLLMQDPKIAILDEPSANLDPKNSLFLFEKIKEFALNRCLILITHDLNLAKAFAESIFFMNEDGLFYCGDAEEFFEKEIFKIYGGYLKKGASGEFYIGYS